jgi:hypothetical protein
MSLPSYNEELENESWQANRASVDSEGCGYNAQYPRISRFTSIVRYRYWPLIIPTAIVPIPSFLLVQNVQKDRGSEVSEYQGDLFKGSLPGSFQILVVRLTNIASRFVNRSIRECYGGLPIPSFTGEAQVYKYLCPHPYGWAALMGE